MSQMEAVGRPFIVDIRSILRNSFRTAREKGVLSVFGMFWRRIGIRYHEKAFGIHTEEMILLPDLGIHNPDCVAHVPTEYTAFKLMMRELAIVPSEHVFLDYGAGMGRVMVLAATYPFRRVLGVEITAKLAKIARANLEKSRSHLRCKDFEVITSDATLYSPPSDVSIIYFYNPFFGEVLESVLKNVQRLTANSHSPLLVCNVPESSRFEVQIRRHGWLELIKEFPLPKEGRCLIFRAKPSPWNPVGR